MTGLEAFLPVGSGFAVVYLAAFIRLSAAMMVLPVLGEQTYSVRIKLVIAILLAMIIAPVSDIPVPDSGPTPDFLYWLLVTEAVSGLFAGMLLRLMFMAIQIAGVIAAQSTSLSQLFAQQGVEPLPAIGNILSLSALTLLVIMDYHTKVVEYFVFSYDWLPAHSLPDPASLAQLGRDTVAEAFTLAFSLSAPFSIAALLYNFVLGVINKAMPTLMVAFVGAPLITLGSIVTLLLSITAILLYWVSEFETMLSFR